MKISAAFPSTYLKASDLQGRRVKVNMSHVSMEDLGGDLKPILFFIGKDKGLVLNKTNSNAIVSTYGDDTDLWNGQVVELYEAQVDFQGRQVAAIRVFVPRQVPAAAPIVTPMPLRDRPISPHAHIPKENPVGTVTIDDEIPF